IAYVDAGTSGGVWGLERGYCLMIGGEKDAVGRLAPIFATLAPGRGAIAPSPGRKGGSAEEGRLHCGPPGAGHFVKLAHRGLADSGDGRWTVQAAIDEGVPAEVITSALFARFRSRQQHTFAEKCLSAMRYQFGGHVEAPAGG